MHIASRMSDMLGKYLDLNAEQLKMTAQNMANVDTPGFKTLGVDFKQAFSQAMKVGALQDNGGDAELKPRPQPVDGLVARPDGNNVSMDREALNLAKTQMQFRMGIEFLKHEFASTMSAIHADAK